MFEVIRAWLDQPGVQALKPFSENPLAQLAGIVGSVIGVWLTVFVFLLAKKERRPRFGYESKTLVEGVSTALDGLQVVYRGIPQERVTITNVYFWNAGRETIRRTDLADASPLLVEVPAEARVLLATVTHSSDKACQFNAIHIISGNDEPTRIKIEFDYLDKRDGGVIQIVHTGPSSLKIQMTGKVIGGGKIRRRLSADWSKSERHGEYAGPVTPIAYIGFSLAFLGIFSALGATAIWLMSEDNFGWYVWLLSLLSVGGLSYWLFFMFTAEDVPLRLLRRGWR